MIIGAVVGAISSYLQQHQQDEQNSRVDAATTEQRRQFDTIHAQDATHAAQGRQRQDFQDQLRASYAGPSTVSMGGGSGRYGASQVRLGGGLTQARPVARPLADFSEGAMHIAAKRAGMPPPAAGPGALPATPAPSPAMPSSMTASYAQAQQANPATMTGQPDWAALLQALARRRQVAA